MPKLVDLSMPVHNDMVSFPRVVRPALVMYETWQQFADHVGMTGEATHWLLDQGIKMMGTDAVTFDPPVWAMFERKQFWEAHRVMLEREYYHLENMANFDQLPPHGFKLSLFPIKWVNTTAAPVRAVAILDEA